jgi:hypothetical protein
MLLLTFQLVAGATSAKASQSTFGILFGAAQNPGMSSVANSGKSKTLLL